MRNLCIMLQEPSYPVEEYKPVEYQRYRPQYEVEDYRRPSYHHQYREPEEYYPKEGYDYRPYHEDYSRPSSKYYSPERYPDYQPEYKKPAYIKPEYSYEPSYKPIYAEEEPSYKSAEVYRPNLCSSLAARRSRDFRAEQCYYETRPSVWDY